MFKQQVQKSKNSNVYFNPKNTCMLISDHSRPGGVIYQ